MSICKLGKVILSTQWVLAPCTMKFVASWRLTRCPGSVTRSMSWSSVENSSPTRLGVPLPVMIKPGLTEILINAEPSINEIVERTYPSEPSMYEPVAELMSSILDQSRTEDNPGVKVEI